MTVRFLPSITKGWKSFEIVGWNNSMIRVTYFKENDHTFPIVCHVQYLAIFFIKIFM